MSVDTRKRQKKLEKQKAKKKAERKELVRRESRGMPGRLQAAATSPILHCCHGSSLWEMGIGNVLVSRELPSGSVAFAMFLVDVYCLGAKDAFYNILPRAVYESQILGSLRKREAVRHIRPEAARKLVESAVEYAQRFDLPPHSDYRTAKLIFGDIAAEACREEFVFGKDGKPYFFAGPHDDRDRCQLILRALERSCGPGGYHYAIRVDPSDEIEFLEDDEV